MSKMLIYYAKAANRKKNSGDLFLKWGRIDNPGLSPSNRNVLRRWVQMLGGFFLVDAAQELGRWVIL